MSRIYLDHNATTPIHPVAKKAYQAALDHYGNPSSIHQEGQSAKVGIENARDQISSCLDCASERLIFTSSGTESNATILYGKSLKKLCNQDPVHIITSTSEHACILNTCSYLESLGAKISYVPCNNLGQINPRDVKQAITEDTCLISIMYANNETGVIQDIQEISTIAHEHSIDCHSDTTQAFGKIPLSINDLGLDYASISSHKCYAPKGVGGLIVKDKDTLPALLRGGGQERLIRSGTENVPGILAFAASTQELFTSFDSIAKHYEAINQYLLSKLNEHIPGYRLNGSLEHKLPNTLNIAIPGKTGEELMMHCDLNNIAIATGSACSTGSIDPSHVLIAMGQSEEESLEACRISWGLDTSTCDIDNFIRVLKEYI